MTTAVAGNSRAGDRLRMRCRRQQPSGRRTAHVLSPETGRRKQPSAWHHSGWLVPVVYHAAKRCLPQCVSMHVQRRIAVWLTTGSATHHVCPATDTVTFGKLPIPQNLEANRYSTIWPTKIYQHFLLSDTHLVQFPIITTLKMHIHNWQITVLTETWLHDSDVHWLNSNTLNQDGLKIFTVNRIEEIRGGG